MVKIDAYEERRLRETARRQAHERGRRAAQLELDDAKYAAQEAASAAASARSDASACGPAPCHALLSRKAGSGAAAPSSGAPSSAPLLRLRGGAVAAASGGCGRGSDSALGAGSSAR